MVRKSYYKRDMKRFSLPVSTSTGEPGKWGGLNTNYSTSQIGDNQAQDLLNVIFTKELEKRGGYTELNSTAITGSTGIYGLFPYYYNNGASRKLIYASHTVLGEINTSTGAVSGITAGLTSNQRTFATTYQNLLILTNGSNNPQKINEST